MIIAGTADPSLKSMLGCAGTSSSIGEQIKTGDKIKAFHEDTNKTLVPRMIRSNNENVEIWQMQRNDFDEARSQAPELGKCTESCEKNCQMFSPMFDM